MNKVNSSVEYQRIKQVMDNLNFSSDRRFAEAIGVSPQNLYDLKSGKTKSISRSLVDKITEKYPQFNAAYLVSGSGALLNSAPSQTIQGNNIHHNTNGGSDTKYIAHLEEEIKQLREEKDRLLQIIDNLTKK